MPRLCPYCVIVVVPEGGKNFFLEGQKRAIYAPQIRPSPGRAFHFPFIDVPRGSPAPSPALIPEHVPEAREIYRELENGEGKNATSGRLRKNPSREIS